MTRAEENELRTQITRKIWWHSKTNNLDHRKYKTDLFSNFRDGKYKNLDKISDKGRLQEFYRYICESLDLKTA